MRESLVAVAGIILLTVAPGVLLAGAVAPARSLILLPAGLSIGLGVSSLLYFWMRLLGGPFRLTAAVEFGLLLAAAALWRRRWRRQDGWAGGPEWVGLAVFVPCVLIGLAVYQVAARTPHGQWDAWAIWNLRARFLFRGADLGTVFSGGYAWSHPDYPVLLPSIVAHWWQWLGGELQQAPAALGALFTAAVPLALFCSLARLASVPAALLASTVFLVSGSYLAHGASQYADVPLSAYFLLSLAFYAFYDLAPGEASGWAELAGLCAGLAAWTKNEGLLFLVALAAGRLVSFGWRRDRAKGIEELKAVVFGAAAPLLTLAVFKGFLAPDGDLVASLSAGQGEKLMDPARQELVWRAFAGYFESLPAPLLLIVAAIAALSVLERRAIALVALCPLTVIALMHAGYFVVYLTTPYDLQWHLDTSFSRLMVQLWPSLVFAACLLAAPPLSPDAPPLLARSEIRSGARLLRPRP